MKRKSYMLLTSVVLSGCSKAPAVPDVVQKMMDAEIPADGLIHVQSRGKITIRRETPTCFLPEGFLLNEKVFFHILGQGSSHDGAGRFQPADMGDRCSLQPDTVFMRGVERPNRRGYAYNLVFIAWQGDPERGGGAWVGRVERLNGPRPEASSDNIDVRDAPSFWGPTSAELVQKALIESSIKLDVSQMSISFAKAVKSR